MDYNFVEVQDTHLKYGIEWFNDDGDLIGTDWYDTEEERMEAVDVWYADQDEHTLEQ